MELPPTLMGDFRDGAVEGLLIRVGWCAKVADFFTNCNAAARISSAEVGGTK
jgi:hypothetical protein